MASRIRSVQATVNRLGRGPDIPSLALTAGALALALILAVCGLDIGAVVLVLVSVGGEYVLARNSPKAALLMDQASFGVPMRFAIRIITALIASSRIDGRASFRALTLVGIAYAVLLCARALHTEYRLIGPLKPMRTRNIPGNPGIATGPDPRTVLMTITQLAVLAPAVLGAPWWLVAALGVIAIAALAYATVPEVKGSWQMRQQKRATGLTGPLRDVQKFIDGYRPEVLVHLSGPSTANYQINTWIESLESLDQNVLIVLRDDLLFDRLAATTIPTIELKDPGELMMLDLAPVRIALYPSNTGNNIHILRLPNVMSAFIGHGDSDKSASNNPFSRVYDELWVAGEAGADRYRKSNLGIHEDHYRLVGRPQVHPIRKTPRLGEDELPVVLYAPTWEGVNLEQEYSSASAVGIRIIEALIAADPPLRIFYKPHPFTGQRDAKYRGVHSRIVTLLDNANQAKGTAHRVIGNGGNEPTINDCFNQASALISDISSVVSDFLASEKPYAVFNHAGTSESEFTSEFPSTRAATIIGRDGTGIDAFIDVVTRSALDTKAADRAVLATYLLGAADQRTLAAFQRSVSAFIARSETERSGYRGDVRATLEMVEFDEG